VSVRFHPTVELAPGADLPGANPTGWSWTDITSYTHAPSKISITRGRRDRYATTGPSSCSLVLLNPDGIWVPDNPMSPYYGLIDQNTPLRVLNRPNDNQLSDSFNRTEASSWGNADSGGAWTNTGGAASDYSVAAASGGRHLHTAAATRHHSQLGLSILRSDQTVKVRVNALSTGAAQSAGLLLRYVSSAASARAELQFATSGAITVRLVERAAALDTVVASEDTGLTHSTSTWVWIRVQTFLQAVRVKAWQDGTDEPTTWQLDGTDDATLAANTGTLGLTSIRETGNTNANASIDFDSYSMVDGPRYQFTGYVDQWPTSWADESETVAFADITASGQLRRLGLGKALKSALYRASTKETYATTPPVVAYWPMEDDSGATMFASGVSGGPAVQFTDVRPGSASGFAGSESLPTGGPAASWRAPVPAYAASTEWGVRFALQVPAPAAQTAVIAWACPTSTVRLWAVYINTDGTFTIGGFNAANVNVLGAGTGALPYGDILDRQLYVAVNAYELAGNIEWDITVNTDDSDASALLVGSVAGTNGNISLFSHDALQFTNGGQVIGHLLAASNSLILTNGAELASGYAGELTSARFARLATEENIPVFFGSADGATNGSTVQAMGEQRQTTLLQQLRDCELTEEGVLFDGKQGQLILLPRTMRQNATVALTLDHDQGQVGAGFSGIRDDYLLRTEVTINRSGGSRAAVATDLEIARLVGIYSDSVTINSNTDADMRPRADWRLGMGKVREIRYPQISLDLTRNSDLVGDWLDTDVGSRLAITNVPPGLPPDDLDLIVEGYTEVFDSFTWRVAINTGPARPWNVFTIAGGGNRGRLASAGSTLNAGINSSTTSLSVASTGGSLWKTGATSFDIGVGGERMTVTNITGASSPQTFTVTRSVNGVVKSHLAATAVGLWKAGVVAL
jgi:hypothetical protein